MTRSVIWALTENVSYVVGAYGYSLSRLVCLPGRPNLLANQDLHEPSADAL